MCVASDPTRVTSVCESWAACAAPAPRELNDLHGPGSSPTALSQPSCTGVSIRVARLQPAPYTEYWSRLPARHLPILSPPAYAVLAPLLPSCSIHTPRGTMLEMLGRLSDQFSACILVQGACTAPCSSSVHQPARLRLISSLPAPCPALRRTMLEMLGSSHHPPPQAWLPESTHM